MCTRYWINKADPAIDQIIKEMQKSPLIDRFLHKQASPILASGEIRPTDVIPVIAPDKTGQKTVYPMKWGYRLDTKYPLFNARSETAAEKPLFKEDWQRHRCIVPASYYFEWSSAAPVKEKYAIQPANATMTWLCGLYQINDGLPYFVILTREPVGELANLHDRMPLILPENKITDWIRPETDPSTLLPFALTDMVLEKAE
ncbi:MAG: SOS response-associated peptidase [Lachnospiraceae bacterium]|nr:SOS response-associated peptidase [Lachnospiraceae bacterium]